MRWTCSIRGRFDGFCLVSSDSDFTRLAARIREQGVDVFGFGEQKTPESFPPGVPPLHLHREFAAAGRRWLTGGGYNAARATRSGASGH